jgi:hypothetical protein
MDKYVHRSVAVHWVLTPWSELICINKQTYNVLSYFVSLCDMCILCVCVYDCIVDSEIQTYNKNLIYSMQPVLDHSAIQWY